MKVNGFKLARIKAGLSQEEAAAKLGVSRVTVSDRAVPGAGEGPGQSRQGAAHGGGNAEAGRGAE